MRKEISKIRNNFENKIVTLEINKFQTAGKEKIILAKGSER